MKRKQLKRRMVKNIRRFENNMLSMERYLEKEYLEEVLT